MAKGKLGLVVIIRLIGPMVTALSPSLRKMVEQMINNLRDKAEKTENKWDDLFVEVLADLLNVEDEDGE